MADIFSYSALPSYGQNVYSPENLTKLQKQRLGYWTGEKPKFEYELGKLYQDKFTNLAQMKTVDFQNLAAAEQSRKNLLQHGKGNISASMGGMQKDSYWRNPSSASAKLSAKLQDRAMYKDISQQTGLPITELKNVQGLNVSTNKWIPVDEFIKSSDFAGTSTFTMNEAGTKVLNPNFTGADKLANLNANLAASTVGKIGAGFAGAPTTIGGLVGTGIQMFGGDNDPTTHTGMEAAGEWLSWGSTAAKVA